MLMRNVMCGKMPSLEISQGEFLYAKMSRLGRLTIFFTFYG